MRLFAAAALFTLLAAPASADQLWLTMDQVRPYDIARPAGQIIIGNPAIADVKVQNNSRVLLFGKAPGMTNMFILDAEGKEIDNLIVRVRSNNVSMLTFQRGLQRLSLNCSSNCETTVTVGDASAVFGETSQQVDQKYSQAQGAASASKQ
jgi:Flp pilus assembly secretin CpaC